METIETNQNPQWDHEKGVWVGEKAKQQQDDIPDPLWIFGYGSLCFKYGEMQYDEIIDCKVEGYIRRFWQKSMDHRGTPETPGLVCTLLSQKEIEELQNKNEFEEKQFTFDEKMQKRVYEVYGKAFRIKKDAREQVLSELDYREKGGYSRDIVKINHGDRVIHALLYKGTICNPAFQKDYKIRGDIKQQAMIIARTVGPSGQNSEYFLNLYNYLKDNDQLDSYMKSLYEEIQTILK